MAFMGCSSLRHQDNTFRDSDLDKSRLMVWKESRNKTNVRHMELSQGTKKPVRKVRKAMY